MTEADGGRRSTGESASITTLLDNESATARDRTLSQALEGLTRVGSHSLAEIAVTLPIRTILARAPRRLPAGQGAYTG